MRKLLIAAVLLSATGTSALAQGDAIPLRVQKLEKEMSAVQRKVFGASGPVSPEISDPEKILNGGSGALTTPITDLTARVDALESQLKSLTGQMEVDANRIRKLEDAVKLMKTDTNTRLKALEGTGGATDTNDVTPSSAPTPLTPKPTPIAVTKPAAPKAVAATPARTPLTLSKPAAPTKAAVLTKPDPARKSALAAIEIPDSGDAAEDAYSYGFRLWTAKLYPEAQVKLKEFVSKYPKHRKTSYAQNLLGRAYMDEGKPALASVAFYENYTKNPRGERAPESLYYLGMSLTKLKKTADACKVFDEFNDVYGATASADLKGKVAKGRTDAKCST